MRDSNSSCHYGVRLIALTTGTRDGTFQQRDRDIAIIFLRIFIEKMLETCLDVFLRNTRESTVSNYDIMTLEPRPFPRLINHIPIPEHFLFRGNEVITV